MAGEELETDTSNKQTKPTRSKMDAAAVGLGLQRSEISFRRTGSSGLVWDDKFLGELAKIKPDDTDPPRASSSDPSSAAAKEVVEKQGFKTMKVPSPSIDPPSPKVSGCTGICNVFKARGGGKSKSKRAAAAAKVGKRRV